jgi:hypothetical protein
MCGTEVKMFESRYKKAKIHFCNKSCHRKYKNKVSNPSKNRDLSGENNPMYGKHPVAWNKGLFKNGSIHKRKDGYSRIRYNGKRELLHRFILKEELKEGNVVHHIDGDRNNNKKENLIILKNQSEHARLHSSS